jgi:hypothetical protein
MTGPPGGDLITGASAEAWSCFSGIRVKSSKEPAETKGATDKTAAMQRSGFQKFFMPIV